MYKINYLIVLILFYLNNTTAQDTTNVQISLVPKVSGYHAGVVQIIFAHNNGETVYFDRTSV